MIREEFCPEKFNSLFEAKANLGRQHCLKAGCFRNTTCSRFCFSLPGPLESLKRQIALRRIILKWSLRLSIFNQFSSSCSCELISRLKKASITGARGLRSITDDEGA